MKESNKQTALELDEEELSVEKIKRMIIKIYALEKNNTKTSKYGEREMKDQIKSIIEEEVGKCF